MWPPVVMTARQARETDQAFVCVCVCVKHTNPSSVWRGETDRVFILARNNDLAWGYLL